MFVFTRNKEISDEETDKMFDGIIKKIGQNGKRQKRLVRMFDKVSGEWIDYGEFYIECK